MFDSFRRCSAVNTERGIRFESAFLQNGMLTITGDSDAEQLRQQLKGVHNALLVIRGKNLDGSCGI